MYGLRELTSKEEEYFITYFKYMIDELKCGRRFSFDLSGKGINPMQVKDIMAKLGYSVKKTVKNEYELDCWYYFNDTDIWMYSNGLTYSLTLNGGKTFRLEN